MKVSKTKQAINHTVIHYDDDRTADEKTAYRIMSETRKKRPSLGFIMAIAAIVMAFVALMLPNLVKARSRSSLNACVPNLWMVDEAKQAWAKDKRKQSSDTPTMTDLCGPTNYMREIPQCPATGVYTLGRIDQKPRCSFPGHEAFLACAEAVDESGRPLAGVRFEGLAGHVHLFRGKTDSLGRTDLPAVYDTDAETWKHGTNRFVVTKRGYRTEKFPMPDFWPLRVVLKKE